LGKVPPERMSTQRRACANHTAPGAGTFFVKGLPRKGKPRTGARRFKMLGKGILQGKTVSGRRLRVGKWVTQGHDLRRGKTPSVAVEHGGRSFPGEVEGGELYQVRGKAEDAVPERKESSEKETPPPKMCLKEKKVSTELPIKIQ